MRITILKENQATRLGLLPGHGLAMLVETADTRVLLDTGPDDTILVNAAALGVPLTPLDAIVLSHGHYDHTGGLAAVLQVAGPVRVLAQPGVFGQTFSGREPGELRAIGMPLQREAYETLGARFELDELPVELGAVLMTTGHIPPLPLHPQRRVGLWRSREGVPYPDDFRDDCSLVARLRRGSAVITGCAHAGLLNILCKAQTIVPDRLPRIVLGGLHLGKAVDEEVREIASEAYSLGVRTLLPCHCTGERAVEVLQECFAGKVIPVGTGSVITIGAHGKVVVTAKLDLRGNQT
ncbi:MAG: MBL fold metallo-hydrolase [Armatimonadia bacterium]